MTDTATVLKLADLGFTADEIREMIAASKAVKSEPAKPEPPKPRDEQGLLARLSGHEWEDEEPPKSEPPATDYRAEAGKVIMRLHGGGFSPWEIYNKLSPGHYRGKGNPFPDVVSIRDYLREQGQEPVDKRHRTGSRKAPIGETVTPARDLLAEWLTSRGTSPELEKLFDANPWLVEIVSWERTDPGNGTAALDIKRALERTLGADGIPAAQAIARVLREAGIPHGSFNGYPRTGNTSTGGHTFYGLILPPDGGTKRTKYPTPSSSRSKHRRYQAK